MTAGTGDGATSASHELEVTDADTASALGSGDLPVLATPRLVAWLEAAACVAARQHLGEGQTSVGTHVDLHHRAATAVGARVRVTARLSAVQDRTLEFALEAVDVADGTLLADGAHTRVIVDRERFLGRLPTP